MAVSADLYGPFDSGAGANWTEDNWRKMMRHMLGSQSGVIRGFTNECEVYADSTGMQVKMRTGEAFIRGHYAEFTSEKTLPITAAHATLARKDRVVLRADFVNNRIEVDVLTGTPAASPSAPTVTTTTSTWETSLAIVDIPAADTSIGSSQVTDDRVYTSAQGRWSASTFQVITNNTFNKLNFDTTVSRSGDVTADLTNDTFTLLRSGLWIAVATLRFVGNTTGKRELLIADPADVSGATCSNLLGDSTEGGHSAEIHLNAVTMNRFSAGKVLAAFGFQSSGADLNTVAGGNSVTFSVMWVGP